MYLAADCRRCSSLLSPLPAYFAFTLHSSSPSPPTYSRPVSFLLSGKPHADTVRAIDRSRRHRTPGQPASYIVSPASNHGCRRLQGQGRCRCCSRHRRPRPAALTGAQHTPQRRPQVCAHDRARVHREQRPVQRQLGANLPGRSNCQQQESTADPHSRQPSSRRQPLAALASMIIHARATPPALTSNATWPRL
jgi:hypothetical protein